MAFQFAYRNTFLVSSDSPNIRIPLVFDAGYRVIVHARLLAGLGDNVRSLGKLSQLLFVPGLGDVTGDSFALSPFYQLIVPTSEFNFRLVYQPIQKSFQVELSIWVDTIPISLGGGSGGVDHSASIAAMQTELTLIAQTQANVILALTDIGEDIAAQSVGLSALATGQTAIATLIGQLVSSEQIANTAILVSLGSIETRLNLLQPPPPSALGIAYVVSQSSVYQGVTATYARLTDSDGTTGGACTDATTTEWIAAAFPETVKVATVTVGAGQLTGWGQVAFYCNGAKLQYSNNGTTWVEVWTVAGLTDTGATQYITHTLQTPIEARYWRLYGKAFLAVSEFKFA